MDILNRNTRVTREYSPTLNPEVLNYTVTSAGVYYARVDLYSSNPTAYNFTIKINGVQQGSTYYDTVLAYTTARTVVQFSTQNACKIQLIYTGRVCNIYLYAPGVNVVTGAIYASDNSTNMPKTITTNLNVSGNWNFIIHHGVTSSMFNL